MVSYPIVLLFDRDSEVYNAFFPDLDGVYTFGEIIEEAVINAKDALKLWLEGKDLGELPPPSDVKKLKEKFEYVELIEV